MLARAALGRGGSLQQRAQKSAPSSRLRSTPWWAHEVFGLTRDELRYVLDPDNLVGEGSGVETFKALRNREKRQLGEYRTQRLVLEAWDRFERDGTFGHRTVKMN